MYIPLTPWPAWTGRAASPGDPPADGLNLWRCHHGHAVACFGRGSSALAALLEVAPRRGPQPVVLAPSYYCAMTLAPLQAAGVRVLHYRVEADLTPVWSDLDRLAAVATPDLLLLVHYFGRVMDGTVARAWARQHDVLLVEDAAHCLAAQHGLGAAESVVLLSPHKLWPVPPVGVLSGPPELVVEAAAGQSFRSHAADGQWWVKRRLQGLLAVAALPGPWSPRRTAGFLHQACPTGATADHTVSRAARRRLGALGAPMVAAAARQRVAHYEQVTAALQEAGCWNGSASGWTPSAGAAPYVLALHTEAARLVYDALQRQGVPARPWPDLPGDVRRRRRYYRTAWHWRRRLLLLPVHQSLRPGQVRQMARALVEVLRRHNLNVTVPAIGGPPMTSVDETTERELVHAV